MKIVFIEDSSFMGGVQYSTFFLAEQIIKEKSANVRIFLPSKGPFSILCQKNAIPFGVYSSIPYTSTSISLFNDECRIPNPFAWIYNMYAILLNSVSIKKKLKQQTPNLIITKGLLNHLSSGLACRGLNLPIIWHLQDLITNRYFGLMELIFNDFAKKIPNHIICDGQAIKELLKKEIQNKSTVVLNGIKTDTLIRDREDGLKVRNAFNIPNDAYVIGYLARITPWKGQKYLLNAFIQYARKNQDSYLLLVGSALFDNDKYQRHLIDMIKENELESRVSMPGYRTDLNDIFSAMDLFVHPSLEKDTSPLALLSALSAGLPVGVSNISSLSEITNLCPAVDIFNPKSLEEIILLMKKYEDPKLRKKRGEINRKSGVNYFDISNHSLNMVQTIEKAYRNTL